MQRMRFKYRGMTGHTAVQHRGMPSQHRWPAAAQTRQVPLRPRTVRATVTATRTMTAVITIITREVQVTMSTRLRESMNVGSAGAMVSVSPRRATNDPLVATAMTTTLKEDKGGLDEIKRQLAVHIGSEEARHPPKLDKRERPELPKIPPILIRRRQGQRPPKVSTTHGDG